MVKKILLLVFIILWLFGAVPVVATTIGVDLSHGESDKGLAVLTDENGKVLAEGMIKTISDVTWVYIGDPAQADTLGIQNVGDKITYDTIKDIDFLLIGQPTQAFTPEEIQAIIQWWNDGNRILWIAADGDYPSKDRIDYADSILDAIGANLRIDLASVEDATSNVGAGYRVVALVNPDPDTPEKDMLTKDLTNGGKVLFHGPGVIAYVDDSGNWQPLKPNAGINNVYVIVTSSDKGQIIENSDPLANAYTAGDTGKFPLMAVEVFPDKKNVLIVSGETPYGGYMPIWAPEFRGFSVDGPQFVTNFIHWAIKVANQLSITAGTQTAGEPSSTPAGETSGITKNPSTSSKETGGINTAYVIGALLVLAVIGGVVAKAKGGKPKEKPKPAKVKMEPRKPKPAPAEVKKPEEPAMPEVRKLSHQEPPVPGFPPELLRKYEPLEFLGEGGFAKVFKVTRKKDGKIVALKIPRIDERTSKTFIKEVSTWLHLNHPNIVKLYDVDIFPIPYLEMEYIEGVGIDGKVIRDLDGYPKPLDEKTALKLIRSIAEGLKHAHSKGIYHRDLKPLNILLKSDLTPKITDWGLAKLGTMSSSRSVLGYTPLYASPEHLMPSKYGHTDERTDIWQLGVTFYELLTGRLPFEGYTYEEVFGKIVDEGYKFTPPSKINPELAKYDGVFEKLLAKRKEERYQSVDEFLQDLEKLREVERRKEELEKEVEELKKSLTRSMNALKESKSAEEIIKNRRLVVEILGKLALAYAELNRKAELLNTLNDLKFYTMQNLPDLTSAISTVEMLIREDLPVSRDFTERLKVLVHNIKRENGV